jgi:hypothetical protein
MPISRRSKTISGLKGLVGAAEHSGGGSNRARDGDGEPDHPREVVQEGAAQPACAGVSTVMLGLGTLTAHDSGTPYRGEQQRSSCFLDSRGHLSIPRATGIDYARDINGGGNRLRRFGAATITHSSGCRQFAGLLYPSAVKIDRCLLDIPRGLDMPRQSLPVVPLASDLIT